MSRVAIDQRRGGRRDAGHRPGQPCENGRVAKTDSRRGCRVETCIVTPPPPPWVQQIRGRACASWSTSRKRMAKRTRRRRWTACAGCSSSSSPTDASAHTHPTNATAVTHLPVLSGRDAHAAEGRHAARPAGAKLLAASCRLAVDRLGSPPRVVQAPCGKLRYVVSAPLLRSWGHDDDGGRGLNSESTTEQRAADDGALRGCELVRQACHLPYDESELCDDR
eukprot:scaffold5732_cov116-Isochrysis_galbana.AAC.4